MGEMPWYPLFAADFAMSTNDWENEEALSIPMDLMEV